MPTRSAAEVIERSANGSIARTLNRKTSLLRIVPTACGQAADIATGMTRCAGDFRRRAAWSCCDARRLRIDRDVTSRSILGAILPLHDFRYRACHIKPRGLNAAAHDVLLRTSQSSSGGARRNRTDDLLLAKQALSQLSYGPSR